MHRASLLKCPRNLHVPRNGFSKTVPLNNKSTQRHGRKNYYEVLGIPANATQSQIKIAYYKLSKIYHPDKTEGSDVATRKFREVTEAYETLGNYSLRKNYDRILFTGVATTFDETSMSEEGDQSRKFYQSREIRTRPPQEGRSSIYNFDEYYRMHYGQSLKHDIRMRKQYEEYMTRSGRIHPAKPSVFDSASLLLVSVVAISLICLMEIYSREKIASVDKPQDLDDVH